MPDLPQRLQRVFLFLKRIFLGIGRAVHVHRARFQLDRLALPLRLDQVAFGAQTRPCSDRCNNLRGCDAALQNHLKIHGRRAVVELDEVNVLAIPPRLDPASRGDARARRTLQQIANVLSGLNHEFSSRSNISATASRGFEISGRSRSSSSSGYWASRLRRFSMAFFQSIEPPSLKNGNRWISFFPSLSCMWVERMRSFIKL